MPAFPPIVGNQPNILILGSMPGRRSLSEQQYYAHPQNAFWWIMSQVYEIPESISYVERTTRLNEAGVAVWDVLHDCERPGSLDSDIVRQSEQANDFAEFFRRYPSINRVAFNGQAAEKIFKRHCKAVIADHQEIIWTVLPSTSPAHASMNREQKLAIWRGVLT